MAGAGEHGAALTQGQGGATPSEDRRSAGTSSVALGPRAELSLKLRYLVSSVTDAPAPQTLGNAWIVWLPRDKGHASVRARPQTVELLRVRPECRILIRPVGHRHR